MMAEGDGEVKKEAVEAGAGGAGGRPTGARKPAGSPAGQWHLLRRIFLDRLHLALTC